MTCYSRTSSEGWKKVITQQIHSPWEGWTCFLALDLPGPQPSSPPPAFQKPHLELKSTTRGSFFSVPDNRQPLLRAASRNMRLTRPAADPAPSRVGYGSLTSELLRQPLPLPAVPVSLRRDAVTSRLRQLLCLSALAQRPEGKRKRERRDSHLLTATQLQGLPYRCKGPTQPDGEGMGELGLGRTAPAARVVLPQWWGWRGGGLPRDLPTRRNSRPPFRCSGGTRN